MEKIYKIKDILKENGIIKARKISLGLKQFE